MALHNRVNGKVLKERSRRSLEKRVTLSFYKYIHIDDPKEFRDQLYRQWSGLGVMGRIYIAREGINAQLSVPEMRFEEFKNSLENSDLSGTWLNMAVENDSRSFFKLNIVVKDKILSDGLNDKTFDVTNNGKHLDAESFNKLTDDPKTIVVDMRNHYESEIGHFENAILPDTDSFRETLRAVEKQLEYKKDSHIIMYCTGGIRCEKASAYYKHKGFNNVYQLDGGIIKYAKTAKREGLQNKFRGKNFVFDQRLGERISEEIISRCHQCGRPCDTHINCKNDGCHLLFIQCEECSVKHNTCCSDQCAQIIKLPDEEQKELRRGKNRGAQVYKKGRSPKLIYKH